MSLHHGQSSWKLCSVTGNKRNACGFWSLLTILTDFFFYQLWSELLHLGRSKCWGAWNTTCRLKAHTTDCLDERGIERGSAWRSSIKRGRKCHYQSDKNWNLFKGNIGETSERCGLEMGFFPEHMDALLNWTELSVTLNKNWWCK